jgi:hypothetical protein
MSIVHLKNKKNGVTYVYESTAYWDKEKGQARNNRICIGKLNPDSGEVIYNRRFKERQGDNVKPGPVTVTTHQDGFMVRPISLIRSVRS